MLPDPSRKQSGSSEQPPDDSTAGRNDTRRSAVDVNVALRRAYDTAVEEKIPDSLLSLLEKLN